MKINCWILGITFLLCSCEKSLEKYSGLDYIRFVPEFADDSLNYCFGLAGKSDRDTVGIEIAVTGEVVDYDREFALTVNQASTAKEGVHFNIPQRNRVVRANHVTDTLWIEVLNSDELKNSEVYLQLDLLANGQFQLCFPENNSCKIYLTDEVTRPAWWDEWHETYKMLYSDSLKERLLGCARVSAWAAKQELPIAVEVTADLQRELCSETPNVMALSEVRVVL